MFSKLGRGERPLRIGYGRVFHEANAESPLLTGRADFERFHRTRGRELAEACSLFGVELRSFMPHAELTGFCQAARLAGGVEALPLESSLAVPSGPLSAECFAWLVESMLEAIERAGPLDGLYLALHGSMQVDGLAEAPEAVILRKARELVGSDAAIAVSYDLHANLSEGLMEPADIVVAYRSNPHWDLAPTGFRAGNRLIRALRGQCAPRHAWRKLPMVLGGGMTIDFLAPMRGVFRFLRGLENDPRVLSASLFMVHPYTSAERLGWAVHVCTDGDAALAGELADRLADRAWAQRDAELPPMLTAAEALDRAAASRWRKLGPVTLVDVDDVVTAGAPGGNTRIVAELVERDRGLNAFVAVHDPALVEQLWSEPLGSRHRVTLQGTPGYGSPAVALDGVVAGRADTDSGRALRIDVGGARGASGAGTTRVVVTEHPPLPLHPSFWARVGLRARDADVLVQKSFFHYRMFYATTTFQHLAVVSDGATSLERVRRRSQGDDAAARAAGAPTDWRSQA